MFYVTFNPVDSWRRVICRKIELLNRVVPSVLLPGEQCEAQVDPDVLGIRVSVVSSRPVALLKAIREKAFPTYDFHVHGNSSHFRAM